jgi:hypothetical protein
MYWRFFRRIRLLPNLWLNLGKRGASVSVGVRGFRATIGPKNRRLTVGLPGSGLSVTRVERHGPAPQALDTRSQTAGRRLLERALRERRLGD